MSDKSRLSKIKIIALNSPDNKKIYRNSIEFIHNFLEESDKCERLEKMLKGFCDLNHEEFEMVDIVRSELLVLLHKEEILVFPALDSTYGKYLNNIGMISVSAELDTEEKLVFGILHEFAHKKRDAGDMYDPSKHTPKKFGREAGHYIETNMFGNITFERILVLLEMPEFKEFVMDLKNWKPKFIEELRNQKEFAEKEENFIKTTGNLMRGENNDDKMISCTAAGRVFI